MEKLVIILLALTSASSSGPNSVENPTERPDLSDISDSPEDPQTCSRDECDASASDWSAFDANDDAREIIARLAPYEKLCNVDRRNIQDLSFSEFLHRYAYHEPVILRGASDNAKLASLTSHQELIRAYGKSVVRLSTANTHSYDKGKTPGLG